MKNLRKGFTLVEVLVTIVLLGIVGTIVIYNVANISQTSKESDYERYVATVVSAANVYADNNPDAFNQLYRDRAYLYIRTGDLIADGLLDEELVNPMTSERIGKNELVKANLDSSTGAVAFVYPVEENKEESYLVSVDEYIVWGEPYDCMQGAGTYMLALANEDGSMIHLNDPETIKKYNFSCKFPSEWKELSTSDKTAIGLDASKTYKKYDSTEDGGMFEITYSWITESGTRKEGTRKVKVQSKVNPVLKGYQMKNGIPQKEVNIGQQNEFTPVIENNKDWLYLAIKPELVGADKSNTTYKISKKSWASDREVYALDSQLVLNNKAVTTITTGTNDYTNNYDQYYTVDDGKMAYEITSKVKGHYVPGYEYDSKNIFYTYVSLYIPDDFIQIAEGNTCDVWSMSKQLVIYYPYSTTGIYGYKVIVTDALTNAKTEKEVISGNKITKSFLSTSILHNSDIKKDSEHLLSTYKIDLVNNNSSSCAITQYTKVKFIPINKRGFIGSESKVSGSCLNVSNRFGLVLSDNLDTNDCATGCRKTGLLDSDTRAYINSSSSSSASSSSTSSFAMNGLDCYYCSGKKYIKIKNTNQEYVILGVYKNKATTEKSQNWSYLISPVGYMRDGGSHTNGKYNLAEIHKDTWTITTCDGVYSTPYDVVSATFRRNIMAPLTDYTKYINVNNFANNLQRVQWKANVGAAFDDVFKNNLPHRGIYKYGTAEFDRYAALVASYKSQTDFRYDSKVGVPGLVDAILFKGALFDAADPETYWLATTYNTNKAIRVSHGDTTTVLNTFYYVRKPGNDFSKAEYLAKDLRLKPMMKLNNINCVLSGTGTKDNPYVVVLNS